MQALRAHLILRAALVVWAVSGCGHTRPKESKAARAAGAILAPPPRPAGDIIEAAALSHVLRALYFSAQNRPGAAIAHFRLAMVYDPQSPTLARHLATAWHRVGRERRSWQVLEKGLERNPNDAALHVLAGLWANQQGDHVRALEHFAAAKGADSPSAQTAFGLLDSLLAQRRTDEARRLANTWLTMPQVPVAVVRAVAQACEDHGWLDLAAAAYAHAMRMHVDAQGLADVQRVLFLQNLAPVNLPEAIGAVIHDAQPSLDARSIFEVARLSKLERNLDPQLVQAWQQRAAAALEADTRAAARGAAALMRAGQLAQAEKLLQPLLQRDPQNVELAANLAELWLRQGKSKACLALLGRFGPAPALLRHLRARALAALRRPHAAYSELETGLAGMSEAEFVQVLPDVVDVLALSGSHVLARRRAETLLARLDIAPAPADLLMASLSHHFGDVAEAGRLAQVALSDGDQDGALAQQAAFLLAQDGSVGTALNVLQKLVRQNPGAFVYLNALGYVLTDAEKDLARAEVYLRRAYRLSQAEPFVADSLAWCLFKKGDVTGALHLLRRAAAALPNDPVVLSHLGDALAASGDASAALQTYHQALRQRMPQPLRHRLRQRVQSLKRVSCGPARVMAGL